MTCKVSAAMRRLVNCLALLCLLLTKSALAVTITLTEAIPFFQLPYVAIPGVVILCAGTSQNLGVFAFCDDGLGNLEDPVGSVEFFAPDLVNMRTNGMFCTDGFLGRLPSQCPPFFNGDVTVEFEDPPLLELPSETPYAPGMNDPGFAFLLGMPVDYLLLTNVPLPEPATMALIVIGVGFFFAAKRGVARGHLLNYSCGSEDLFLETQRGFCHESQADSSSSDRPAPATRRLACGGNCDQQRLRRD